MKLSVILTTITLLTFSYSFAQKKGKPEIINYTTEDGTLFTVGDTIRFGMGSNPNGGFKYIYTTASFFSNAQYWGAALNGKFATIDQIKKGGNDKMGYTTYFGFRYGSTLSGVNVESAIASGELITPASKLKAEEKNKPIIIQSGGAQSIADELKKLKELLDAGILNQQEFDAQKQKLLEKK